MSERLLARQLEAANARVATLTSQLTAVYTAGGCLSVRLTVPVSLAPCHSRAASVMLSRSPTMTHWLSLTDYDSLSMRLAVTGLLVVLLADCLTVSQSRSATVLRRLRQAAKTLSQIERTGRGTSAGCVR